MTSSAKDCAMLYDEYAKTLECKDTEPCGVRNKPRRQDKDDWYVHDKELTSESVLNLFLNE